MKRLISLVLIASTTLVSAQSRNAAVVHANNILVLIQPALAGPDVNPLNYWQPEWVLWPPVLRDSDGGRLLAISTGENWVGSQSDFEFESVERGRAWRARNFVELKKRGHFIARNAQFGDLRTNLLVGASGSASPNALRLALNEDSPVVRPFRIRDRSWPSQSLMVTEASGWDSVAEIEKSTTGRVLVVEYPPKADEPWTRYWLKGHGWKIGGIELSTGSESAVVPTQPGVPVPGLIRARLLTSLVTHPEKFEASKVSLKNWPGANRFLEVRRRVGIIVAGLWVASFVAVIIWGVVLVANERTSHVLPVMLSGAMLSPAIVTFAGWMGRYLGVEQWPVWMGLASLTLIMAAAGIEAWTRRSLNRAHPLLGVCLVGLLTMSFVNPIWSFMSPLFSGRTVPVSPIAIAAIFGYLAGCLTCVRGCGTLWLWVGRLTCLTFFAGGLFLHGWWTEDLGASLFIPVAALVIGEGRFQRPMLICFTLWPASLVSLFAGGFVWTPLGLLYNGRDTVGLKAAGYVDFLTSPGLLIFLLLAGAVAIFGYRFFFHQLRLLEKLDLRRSAFPLVAISAAAYGLLHPTFLTSSLVLGSGAMAALLFDAVQTM